MCENNQMYTVWNIHIALTDERATTTTAAATKKKQQHKANNTPG